MTPATTPAIALEAVTLSYRRQAVLSELSLSVDPGEIVALVGPSGCGKTTVLRLILGLVAPAEGVVRVDGAIVSKDGCIFCPPEERGLAVVFQDLALWPHLDVFGNLAFGLRAQGIKRGERTERITRVLARVGLADKTHRYPGELSGGERQRVAIARALVLEPRAVLLDEPLANLDVVLKRELLATFRELLTERNATAIYVTHDPAELDRIGTRVAVMERGSVMQTGTVAELQAGPASDFVRDLFD